MALVPYVDQRALNQMHTLLRQLPESVQSNSSASLFFLQAFSSLVERSRQHPEYAVAPVDALFTENFIKGFSHHAAEMGADGLDIVEMLEILRVEYIKHLVSYGK